MQQVPLHQHNRANILQKPLSRVRTLEYTSIVLECNKQSTTTKRAPQDDGSELNSSSKVQAGNPPNLKIIENSKSTIEMLFTL